MGPYEYIRRTYGAVFFPGDTVVDTDGATGVVSEPDQGRLHYVRVWFGHRAALFHPLDLKILARGKRWSAAQHIDRMEPSGE